MSGFPPIQIFLLCLAFAIVAIPLGHLTGLPDLHATMPAIKSTQKSKEIVSSIIRLRYAHRPLSVSLKTGSQELLDAVDLSASPSEVRMPLKISPKGYEAVLTATWPAGTPDSALSIDIEPDGLELRSETRWSSAAQLNEVVTFKW